MASNPASRVWMAKHCVDGRCNMSDAQGPFLSAACCCSFVQVRCHTRYQLSSMQLLCLSHKRYMTHLLPPQQCPSAQAAVLLYCGCSKLAVCKGCTRRKGAAHQLLKGPSLASSSTWGQPWRSPMFLADCSGWYRVHKCPWTAFPQSLCGRVAMQLKRLA